jgi:hypothetical protein
MEPSTFQKTKFYIAKGSFLELVNCPYKTQESTTATKPRTE